MKILIADDHALLRQGLRQNLAEEFPDADFRETGTTQETIEAISRDSFEVIILDVFMPGRSGLEVLDEVQRTNPATKVLVLSSAPAEQLGIRVLRNGANGYLNKQAAPEELINAVRKVLNGGTYVSPALAERLAAEAGRLRQAPHERLSDREFQVMRLLVNGKSLKEIAAELSVSIKTVSTFHTRIWEKLGVSNDVELLRYALAHGLTGPVPGPGQGPAPASTRFFTRPL
jgi:two-component system, NarL family, invasion response regulator UvrY